MKRFTIGDIHGRIKALREVLKLGKFSYKNDLLIVLGDIVDGGSHTYQVVEELLKIKNLVYIIGNHDEFFMNHINSGWAKEIWIQQGGANTLRSYGAKVIEAATTTDKSKISTKNMTIPITHQEFFNKGVYYYVKDKMLFVHGGINPKIPKITSQSRFDLLWDRNLIEYCRKGNKVPNYKKVFVGHTSTEAYGSYAPLKFQNLWMMDCGAGWKGKLALMDIDTEEFWTSSMQTPNITPTLTEISYKKFLEEFK